MSSEITYGYPPTHADPRRFSPDPECCTPEEIATWESALSAANAGQPFAGPRDAVNSLIGTEHTFKDGTTGIVGHAIGSSWGIGTYDWGTVDDDFLDPPYGTTLIPQTESEWGER